MTGEENQAGDLLPNPPRSVLYYLSKVPLIGDALLGLIAVLPPLWVQDYVRQKMGYTNTEMSGWGWLIAGMLVMGWVAQLEEWGRIRIVTPLIPIPWMYATPVVAIGMAILAFRG